MSLEDLGRSNLKIKVQQSLSSEDRTLEESGIEGQLAVNKSIINITNKSVNMGTLNKSVNFSLRTEIQV